MGRLYCLLVLLDFKKIINHYGLTASISLEMGFKCAHSSMGDAQTKWKIWWDVEVNMIPIVSYKYHQQDHDELFHILLSHHFQIPPKTVTFNYDVD